MSFIQDIDALSFPRAVLLYEYYLAKKPADGGLPIRSDFDFFELKPFLPYLFIAEPTSGGADWRYRLLGTRLVFRFGRDSTGIPFSKHFEADGVAEDAIKLSNDVAASGRPRFFTAQFSDTQSSQTRLETMSLPILAPDGETVWLFGGTFFADEEEM
ncbi:MAG: PAS domain-containing protein [Alphaproteobacteria bacterium]|nr:PAS domain-containing protein [Alphaproteobacteria bacterium]